MVQSTLKARAFKVTAPEGSTTGEVYRVDVSLGSLPSNVYRTCPPVSALIATVCPEW